MCLDERSLFWRPTKAISVSQASWYGANVRAYNPYRTFGNLVQVSKIEEAIVPDQDRTVLAQ